MSNRGKLYIILEAPSILELEAIVRRRMEKGWQPLGAPFTFPWAPGHRPIHQAPASWEKAADGWIYVTFCQAMTSTTPEAAA